MKSGCTTSVIQQVHPRFAEIDLITIKCLQISFWQVQLSTQKMEELDGQSVSQSVDRGSSDEHWPMTPRILSLLVSVGLTFWNSPRLAPKEERLARLSRKKHVQGSACARWSFHVINIRRPPAIHCEFNQEEPHSITCIQNNINSLVPLLNNALNAGEEDRDRDMTEMDPKDEWTEVARAVD